MYLDYPKCYQLDFETSEESDQEGNVWECYLYMRNSESETEGYPEFEDPSVMAGYYVSSFIPGQKLLSYAKTEQMIDVSVTLKIEHDDYVPERANYIATNNIIFISIVSLAIY